MTAKLVILQGSLLGQNLLALAVVSVLEALEPIRSIYFDDRVVRFGGGEIGMGSLIFIFAQGETCIGNVYSIEVASTRV